MSTDDTASQNQGTTAIRPVQGNSEAEAASIRQPNVWWVNQGAPKYRGYVRHSIWAQLTGARNQTVVYRDGIKEVRSGDIIVHCANGKVKSVSRATTDAYKCKRPDDHKPPNTDDDGNTVEHDPIDLSTPVDLNLVNRQLDQLHIERGPFDKNSKLKRAYFCRFSLEGLDILKNAVDQVWPDWTSAPTVAIKHWIFEGKPKVYNLAGAVSSLKKLTWQVNQNSASISVGDEVFLWQTGPKASLVATTTVD